MKRFQYLSIILLWVWCFTLEAQTWTDYGPTSVSNTADHANGAGKVYKIYFHPNYDGTTNTTIYATTQMSGIWHSTDDGETWHVLNTDQLPTLLTGDMAFAPGAPNEIILATGESDHPINDGFISSRGIFKSTNSGTTWNRIDQIWYDENNESFTLGPGVIKTIRRIIYHPTNKNILFCTLYSCKWHVNDYSSSIYMSQDGGVTWHCKHKANKTTIRDIAYDLENPLYMYASGEDLLRSTNGGQTWSSISNTAHGLVDTSVYTFSGFSQTNANGVNYLYFNCFYTKTVGGSTNQYAVTYLSTNDGDSFSLQCLNQDYLFTSAGSSRYTFTASPHNEETLFAGSFDVWRSSNGGQTLNQVSRWRPYTKNASDTMHCDIHGITVSPTDANTVFVANDGGIYKSVDGGDNWRDVSEGLGVSQVHGISVSNTERYTKTMAVHDDGNHIGTGNPISWRIFYGGDGMNTLINHTNENYLYTSDDQSTDYYNRVMFSTDKGESISQVLTGTLISYPFNGTTINMSKSAGEKPIEVDPNNGSIFYVGYQRLHKSVSFGTNNSFSMLSIPNGILASDRICAIAIDPANSNNIFIAYESPTKTNLCEWESNTNAAYWIYKTTNGGSTWTDISTSLPYTMFCYTDIGDMKLNPANTNELVFCLRVRDNHQKVMRWNNSQGIWTNISYNLANSDVTDETPNVLVYDNDGWLYLGTLTGSIYYLSPGSTNWVKFDGNLPNARVADIEVDYCSNELVVGLSGRGVWGIALPHTLANIPPIRINASRTIETGKTVEFCRDVVIENNAKVTINNGGKINIANDSKITIKSGSELQIESGALVDMQTNSELIVECGATLDVNGSSAIDLNFPASDVRIDDGAIVEVVPYYYTGYSVPAYMNSSVHTFNNKTFSTDDIVSGKTITANNNVTVKDGKTVLFQVKESVDINTNFTIEPGATFTIEAGIGTCP